LTGELLKWSFFKQIFKLRIGDFEGQRGGTHASRLLLLAVTKTVVEIKNSIFAVEYNRMQARRLRSFG
jgi:hypothetical protein